MAVKMNKKAKAGAARKNAEALKAKKKQARTAKAGVAVATKPGAKGKSIIAQAKKRK